MSHKVPIMSIGKNSQLSERKYIHNSLKNQANDIENIKFPGQGQIIKKDLPCMFRNRLEINVKQILSKIPSSKVQWTPISRMAVIVITIVYFVWDERGRCSGRWGWNFALVCSHKRQVLNKKMEARVYWVLIGRPILLVIVLRGVFAPYTWRNYFRTELTDLLRIHQFEFLFFYWIKHWNLTFQTYPKVTKLKCQSLKNQC